MEYAQRTLARRGTLPAAFGGIIDALLGRTRPIDPTRWHKWRTFSQVRLENGTISRMHGQLWRRWDGKRWIYQQDEETFDDWADRQW